MKFQEVKELNRIVFYDGECGFCNSVVGFILKYRKVDFYFIALQSKTAQTMLSEYNAEVNMKTLYLIKDKKLYDRSSAALQIFKDLTSPYHLVYYGGLLFPKFIRDYLYMQISQYRHQIKSQYCILPKIEEQKFFIE